MNSTYFTRRTIRKYAQRDIDSDLLERLLTAGTRASTTGNMQIYSIIVTRDQEMKKRLAPAHFNQPMVTEAPVMLTFCADFNRFNLWCRQREAEPGYDNFMSFMTAAIDSLLAAQTICNAAEEEGLGICYLGTATYNADRIIEVLELPLGVVPVATVTLGWPAQVPEQPDRLPLEAVVHYEKYHDFTPDLIDSLYREKEARTDSQQFIAANGKETLAQVFTDVRYKKADNEYFSGKFLEVIRRQGFTF
ncbi:MAG: nitroreductase family protein [Bacteroidales bacterium]|jgi:nitroreductase|nr:nitroreductase family protein [Bacteroidales bacterium]MDX9927882.1 nitroreductase family protein [Bacteroidales bacterium]HNX84637.1 nitroreductase family protein [Bacteroidales bacterium]HOC48632.1 nitroreductase family protein [Bacteroidales bacterium]HPS98171.1 nitroreductase family protein [Bacteroidales bacterium]